MTTEEGEHCSKVLVASRGRAIEVFEACNSFAEVFVSAIETGILTYIHGLLPTLVKRLMEIGHFDIYVLHMQILGCSHCE